jgi:hypothetical protein
MVGALALLCAGARRQAPAASPPNPDLPLIEGASYVGVIFPADRSEGLALKFGVKNASYWTPTPGDVAKLEAGLRAALEEGARNPSSLDHGIQDNPHARDVSGEIAKILGHFGEYRRQYVGIVTEAGARRVAVNFFHGGSGNEDWRHTFIEVLDGGAWYWRIQYDVGSGRYLGFSSNGYA